MNQPQQKSFSARPLYQSYAIANEGGLLYAGEYPGDRNEACAREKIQQMTTFGVRHFIDLTEEGELVPYAYLLPSGTTYERFPVCDQYIPSSLESVHHLLQRIDELKRMEGYTYIHCWGGVGRTGTIVGCYLSQYLQHPDIDEVLDLLEAYFSIMPKSAYRVTPENELQVDFINDFIQKYGCVCDE